VLSNKYFDVVPIVAGQGKAEWPIALGDEPQTGPTGSNSIAAHAKRKGDLIVIDFGTATTSTRSISRERTKGHHCAGHQPKP
jgi:type III pantothenate kinase